MKSTFSIFILFIQFSFCNSIIAQKDLGKLKDGNSQKQTIKITEHHQYEFKLKKGDIAFLRLSEFDVRTVLTAVSEGGIVIEKMSTAETADFLVFEAPKTGTYFLFIQMHEWEEPEGTYTLTSHFIKSEGKLDQIKKLIQLVEKPDQAGAVFAIMENDEVIFEHIYGYSNVEHQVLNNNETVFELASVSKQFTAMAIAKLIEQEKLSLEDDIRVYFPELPIYKTQIKIKHLLNHTSGITDSGYPLALAGYEYDQIQIERVLNFLKNSSDQYFDSGSEFAYSNDAYTLLGELVHRITNQSFAIWMKQNVFDPLKMNNTIIRDSPEIIIPNRATSYISYTGDKHFRRKSFDFYAPGGCSVRSNLKDMTKWINYLNQGYHSNEGLFSKLNHVEKYSSGENMEYAYGNFITDFRGIKRISHLGLSAGFNTSLARFPELNFSFIHLGNNGMFENYYLSKKIYEIYLAEHLEVKVEEFEGIKDHVVDERDENITEDLSTQLFLPDYNGSYFSQQINSSYTFQALEDTLYAISSAYRNIALTPIGKDSFSSDQDFMDVIVFKRDYNEEISDCKIYNEDDELGIAFNIIPTVKNWTTPDHWQSKEFLQSMKDTLEDIEASKILPGFVVSIFTETETILQEAYGYRNLEGKQAYNVETEQMIASISKSITGMAIMKAMELGYFELDDSINDYLPYQLINPKYPDEDITIRHLLTHTSSLKGPKNYNRGYVFQKPIDQNNWPVEHYKHLPMYDGNKKMSMSNFLMDVLSPDGKLYDKDLYSDHRPGTNFDYSNASFALLGYIIELTSKTDFKDFTKQHIFDPLEMNSTSWVLEDVNEKNHVTYYLENYNVCNVYTLITIPDGGLYTNVKDLTKFLQEAIKGYSGRGKILTSSSYTEMFRSQSDIIEIEGGLGWDLSIACCIGHAGNDFGIATVMYFEPETGIGRIVFSNISIEKEELSSTFYGIMNLLFYTDLSD